MQIWLRHLQLGAVPVQGKYSKQDCKVLYLDGVCLLVIAWLVWFFPLSAPGKGVKRGSSEELSFRKESARFPSELPVDFCGWRKQWVFVID